METWDFSFIKQRKTPPLSSTVFLSMFCHGVLYLLFNAAEVLTGAQVPPTMYDLAHSTLTLFAPTLRTLPEGGVQ